jgi:glutamate-ammonia-ligase adenylyltransferase
LGDEFIRQLRPILLRGRDREHIVGSIDQLRQAGVKKSRGPRKTTLDIKNGRGGIRDIEFLVQGLQLAHCPNHPTLIQGNTLMAIEALSEATIISDAAKKQLTTDYTFLRQIEHYLQILDDRQIHALPSDPEELALLAKRIFGIDSGAHPFMQQLGECTSRVTQAYDTLLLRRQERIEAGKGDAN